MDKFKFIKSLGTFFFEKALKGILGILIISFFSKSYSIEFFGMYLFIESMAIVFYGLVNLSIDGVLIKLFQREGTNLSLIISNSIILNLISSLLLFLTLIIISNGFSEVELKLILAFFISYLYTPFSVLESYKNFKLKQREYIIPKSIVYLIGSIFKILVLYYKLDFNFFLIIMSLEGIIISIIYFLILKKETLLKNFKFDKVVIKLIIEPTLPLVLVTVFSMIAGKIDQVFIKNMLGYSFNGIYSASYKIIEYFLILPTILMKTFYPFLVKFFSYKTEYFNNIFNKIFIILNLYSLISILVLILFGEFIIGAIFKDEYSDSINVLILLSPIIYFYSLQIIYNSIIYLINKEKIYLLRSILAMSINILLNYLLIPKYGINGAIISTLITYLFNSMLFQVIDRDLRPYLKTNFNFLLK